MRGGSVNQHEIAPLTVKEAAQALRVSPALVYALCAQGRLGHERHGLGRGTIRISREALANYQRLAQAGPSPKLDSARSGNGGYYELDAKRLAVAWRRRGVIPADGTDDAGVT